MGVLLLPSERSTRFGNPAWPGFKTASFAAFWPWPGVLPKNAESLRNSDALMRVTVPRRRGPTGLRDPVVRPLMLRFSVSVRKVSAQSPVNATRSTSHLNPSTTQPSSKNRTQGLTRRKVCALDVVILEVSCYTDDMEKQTECRIKVKEASNLLLELVNDVLDMSKLESDEIVLEESPFNLSKIAKEALVVIEQIAAEQNIRIVWEKKEIIHRDLIGSSEYVKRVMMNILSNAVKYNRANGSIYISCTEIPSEQPGMTTMEFVCRDTGIGMTEEFQKHIFEPFAQEHEGSRTKFAGTGLGMAISRKLVEKMGGTITFESEKGVGTTFVIRVPFKIDLDADKREEQKDVSEKSIKGLHILLAEDNELNMEIAEFMLQSAGAEVTKAWNGQETVELFRNSEPGEFDVILMDIMMPVMNGYEATKMIRSLDREDAKTIPIIAMTANAFTEDRLRAKEAGMDDHVAKPVDVNLLIKVIRKSVEDN